MTRNHANSRAGRVVLTLTAAFLWTFAGVAVAAAPSAGLPRVPKALGQRRPKAARKEAPKDSLLTAISPSAAPPGGIGELVLTGRNFVQGMELRLGCGTISSFKVESPMRAVARIRVALAAAEEECPLELAYPAPPKDETSESAMATREVVQTAKSVRFVISTSAPMPILLGEYTLFPEEEFKLMSAQMATGQKMQQQAEANKLSKDQEKAMNKQADDLKALQEKYKRGEISQAELMAAAMKAASGMMGQLTPQQKAAMGQQAAAAGQMGQTSQKLMDLQKQDKRGELHLKQGSIIFFEGDKALFSEPASALKEIALVSPTVKDYATDFQITFNDGKKYFFRSGDRVEEDVDRLKKRLGK